MRSQLRDKPDLPSKPPALSDKRPQLPGRPALPERLTNKTVSGPASSPRLRSATSTAKDGTNQPQPHQEPKKAQTMKSLGSHKTPLIPNQPTKVPLHGRPAPPGRPRQLRHGSIDTASSIGSNTSSESVDSGTSNADATKIIEEIDRISGSLSDLASEGFNVFNRSLERFVQLSEQMVMLIQSRGTSVSITMKISQLRDKIGQFRGLMTQISSNPSYDYTSQLDSTVSDISRKCGELYAKVF